MYHSFGVTGTTPTSEVTREDKMFIRSQMCPSWLLTCWVIHVQKMNKASGVEDRGRGGRVGLKHRL